MSSVVPIENALSLPLQSVWIECKAVIYREGVYRCEFTDEEGEEVQGDILFNLSHIHSPLSQYQDLPIVVDHPTVKNGKDDWCPYLTCQVEKPAPPEQVGYLVSPRRINNALTAKAMVDIRRLYELVPRVAEDLWEGYPIETSAGSKMDWDVVNGMHEGKAFEYVANALIPHHFAILSEGEGAFGLRSGCGMQRIIRSPNRPATASTPVLVTNRGGTNRKARKPR